jgi:hypothetical protein
MAAGYFGRRFESLAQVHALAGSIGPQHFTLPWGMLLGAASLGLHATFISKHPTGLLAESIRAVAAVTGRSEDCILGIATDQLALCHAMTDRIQLLTWEPRLLDAPRTVVQESLGVAIPTLWWGDLPHNVVLTGFGNGVVRYHDPNTGPDREMSEGEFFEKWCHPNTDHDLLILSPERIDPRGLPGADA